MRTTHGSLQGLSRELCIALLSTPRPCTASDTARRDSGAMIPCKICPGRVFASEYAYNQHAKTSKAHFAKYACTICHQSFPSVFARNGVRPARKATFDAFRPDNRAIASRENPSRPAVSSVQSLLSFPVCPAAALSLRPESPLLLEVRCSIRR